MINLNTKNWEIKNIETILFDKDGTLIDLHYFWGKMTELRANEIVTKFKLSPDMFCKLCKFLGYDIHSKKMLANGITALYSRSKIIEFFQSDLKQVGVNISKLELEEIFDNINLKFDENLINYIYPITEAIEFVKKIHSQNIKLGIVTSDSVKSTHLALKKMSLQNVFDSIKGRESSNYTKESGVLTQLALEELGANPKTTLMIGDAPMDYISAKNANVDNVILVSTGQIAKKELIKTTPFVVNSLSELSITSSCLM